MTVESNGISGDAPVRIPVYSSEGGVHRIHIYEEQADGSFRRTGDEPLRALRDHITGLGPAIGELISIQHDRTARIWRTPTVTARGGHAQSVYEFLRGQVRRRSYPVLARPSLLGRLLRFDVHSLIFKPAIAAPVLSLFARRYCEAIQLWPEHEAVSEDSAEQPQRHAGRG